MNLTHLKYAVEVAKTGSISQAAENLYMGQPNLSKAIRELEGSLGITIFNRTPRGVEPTRVGEEFLRYATQILDQIQLIETLYSKKQMQETFRFAVTSALYLKAAFNVLLEEEQELFDGAEVSFLETRPDRVMELVSTGESNVGIFRYNEAHSKYYEDLIEKRGLAMEKIWSFARTVLVSESVAFAGTMATKNELAEMTELVLSEKASFGEQMKTPEEKYFHISDASTRIQLLSTSKSYYMYVPPVPQVELERLSMAQYPLEGDTALFTDVLIYRKGYRATKLEMAFLPQIERIIQDIS